jgi:hypothetical protein
MRPVGAHRAGGPEGPRCRRPAAAGSNDPASARGRCASVTASTWPPTRARRDASSASRPPRLSGSSGSATRPRLGGPPSRPSPPSPSRSRSGSTRPGGPARRSRVPAAVGRSRACASEPGRSGASVTGSRSRSRGPRPGAAIPFRWSRSHGLTDGGRTSSCGSRPRGRPTPWRDGSRLTRRRRSTADPMPGCC